MGRSHVFRQPGGLFVGPIRGVLELPFARVLARFTLNLLRVTLGFLHRIARDLSDALIVSLLTFSPSPSLDLCSSPLSAGGWKSVALSASVTGEPTLVVARSLDAFRPRGVDHDA